MTRRYEKPLCIPFYPSRHLRGWGTGSECTAGDNFVNNICSTGDLPSDCISGNIHNSPSCITGVAYYYQCCAGVSGIGFGGSKNCANGTYGQTDCGNGGKYLKGTCSGGS
jgi:hypothetical protein